MAPVSAAQEDNTAHGVAPPPSPNVRPPHVSHIPLPSCSTHSSTCPKCLPCHLDDCHIFTTIAEEKQQPPNHPYHTTGGNTVDLAIHDKLHMAHLCHYVMVHTATSLALSRQGQPTKKQCGLKAGFKNLDLVLMPLSQKNSPNSTP